jgi:hypothetical protein
MPQFYTQPSAATQIQVDQLGQAIPPVRRPSYQSIPPVPEDEPIRVIDLDADRAQIKPNTWGD